MASWQKEAGSCVGRGFDAGGFLGKLKAWIVKTAINGGPGWFIVDDQSALGVDPYIVVSDKNFPYSNSNKHKILQIKLPTATAGVIYVVGYHFWDATAHSPVNNQLYGYYQLRTVDAGTFSYDFRGGPECICISSRNGSTIDNCLIDEWVGPDDTIILESESHTGTTTLGTYLEANDNNNQLSGYEKLTGYGPLLDANGKLYFSITFSTPNIGVNIYKDSARTQLVGHITSANYTPGNTVSITADNASGLGGTLRIDAKVANDTDIEVDFTITLGSGQGANFTVGNYYFLFNYSSSQVNIAYCKVLAISGDKLIVDWLGANVMPSGAVIGPYPHRFALLGNNYPQTGAGSLWGFLPYYSCPASEIPTSASFQGPQAGINYNNMITIVNPDDLNYYRASELQLYEVSNGPNQSGTKNRVYGVFKNNFYSSTAAMAAFTDGRTLDNGLNYFDLFHSGSFAWIVKDSTSLS